MYININNQQKNLIKTNLKQEIACCLGYTNLVNEMMLFNFKINMKAKQTKKLIVHQTNKVYR